MSVTLLNYDWKFCKCTDEDASSPQYDDKNWRIVRVPHDYAIEGPFHPDNDKQSASVIADGIKTAIVHVGRTGGLPITDHAWYRRKLDISPTAKRVFLEFDGVMCNSVVYVNGNECATRPYGYSSFCADITDYVTAGSDNILAVNVRPEHSSSRWYPGAGIYRNVRLVEKQDAYFPYCPMYISTVVEDDSVGVCCQLSVVSDAPQRQIHFVIKDMDGNAVYDHVTTSAKPVVTRELRLDSYNRWHIGEGYLYTLTATLIIDGVEKDVCTTKFGIRTLRFDANRGFLINGENVKLKGVCMHHDLGALGAAVNKSAIARQLQKLMDIGVNAIRCSHNPPAPELLELCDEYGLVVIDEAFDEWQLMKIANSYGKYFEEWSKRDLVDMVKRDRNHPCVIMWSLGNEILEQRSREFLPVIRRLQSICLHADPTRPTTCGFNNTVSAFDNGFAEVVDIAGINYKPHLYKELHEKYPDIIMYGSETSSCVSSRGEYFLPAEVCNAKIRENLQVSSYDTESPPWAYVPEREFAAQEDYDFVFGEFVWTGFDYLGEPTPYREEWPSRSSYFGIYDLVGLEKDRTYSYMARWTDKPVMHLFPHWNWTAGDVVDVHCYTSFDSAELFLNGKSLGVQRKDKTDELRRYRLIWEGVEFEAGELKVVAVEDSSVTDIVRTAGTVAKLILEPEKTEISADGDEVVFVRCTAVDDKGTVCPTDSTCVTFAVEGCGEYLASDNGDATDTRTFSETHCKLYNGKCMAILRSLKGTAGAISVTATADNLPQAICTIVAKD